MQGRHQPPTTIPPSLGSGRPRHETAAITWIGQDHAIVARRWATDEIEVAEIDRDTADDGQRFLARIAHEIGDPDHVLVMGTESLRLELEREYVTVSHRPDRLMDVEPATEPTRDELVARLRTVPA
jgi:hypothetical protein